MAQVKQGDTVKIHYMGTLNDGAVFDSTEGREPLQFTLGQGKFLPAFEHAIVGMAKGQSKKFKISSDQAFGPHRQEWILAAEPHEIPEGLPVEVGQRFQIRLLNGAFMPVIIAHVGKDRIVLDANHPMAGEDLNFTVRVVEILNSKA